MDNFGDILFIIFIVIFAIGSYLNSKVRKTEPRNVPMPTFGGENAPESEQEQVPPPIPSPAKRKNKRKGTVAAVAPVPNMPSSPPKETSREEGKAEEEIPGAAFTFETDDLKKAVIYSEILNRKY